MLVQHFKGLLNTTICVNPLLAKKQRANERVGVLVEAAISQSVCKFRTTDQQHSKLPSSSTIEASFSFYNRQYGTYSGSFPLFFHKDDMKHNLHSSVVVVVPTSILLFVWKPMVCVDILFVSLSIR